MNKTSINKLILIGALALVFGFTNTAYAQHDTCTSCDDMNYFASYYSNQGIMNNNLYPTINNANPGNIATATSKNVSTTTKSVSNTSNTNTNTTNTTNKTDSTNNVNNTNTSSAANTNNNSNSGLSASAAQSFFGTNDNVQVVDNSNGLNALSLFGAPGFLPNTVFEWILTFILILILIILTRQFRPVHAHEAHPTAPVHH